MIEEGRINCFVQFRKNSAASCKNPILVKQKLLASLKSDIRKNNFCKKNDF